MRSLATFAAVSLFAASALLLGAGGVKAAPATAQAASPCPQILQAVRASAAEHHHPIVLFDLDDTLLRTAYRNQAILLAWTATDAGKPYAAAAKDIPLSEVGWGIDKALDSLAVPAADQLGAKKFWAAHFFTSEYLHCDRPNPAAVAFVKDVRKAGARVVYLTGRTDKTMRAGTEACLKANGFPWDPTGKEVTLDLKTKSGIDDATFKGEEAKSFARTGEVIASFDNEPANVNMFHRVLPQATVVFLQTVHSPNAVPVDAGIVQVPAFVAP